ncbi:hypothetical protein FQA39_LY04991 [Lamprigera yunnana]|nr:hypothetical protein FQA39_LY04991 [Lamprigera yunnana]
MEFSIEKGKASGEIIIVLSVEMCEVIFVEYFVVGNEENKVLMNVNNEVNINNINIGRDVDNDNAYETNGIKEKMCGEENYRTI